MSQPLSPVSCPELSARLAQGDALYLLDVREPAEFVSELGHIKGSELIPLGTLPGAVGKLAGETREIIVVCRSGKRALQAAELLAQHGHKARVLTGGMIAWNEAQLPIER